MECKHCQNPCIKKGFQRCKFIKKQRYLCKICKQYQLEFYTYNLYQKDDDKNIISLVSKGMSVSSIARYLGYSKQTICRQILKISKKIHVPSTVESDQIYEVDELWTYVGNKENETWISYALNRKSKRVMAFAVGSRSKKDIDPIIQFLKSLNPKKIVTDKLNIYPKMVKPVDHDTHRYRNNRIERSNLTLREHIRRLTRKTISFSKSIIMLEATIKLYFFWNNWIMEFQD